MNGSTPKFNMCEHEELLDCGEYVCIKCEVFSDRIIIFDNNAEGVEGVYICCLQPESKIVYS